MESAQNGTTAYVSECRVDNMRHFVTTMIGIMCCNGYAIAARSKIRKYHMGQDERLKENQKKS